MLFSLHLLLSKFPESFCPWDNPSFFFQRKRNQDWLVEIGMISSTSSPRSRIEIPSAYRYLLVTMHSLPACWSPWKLLESSRLGPIILNNCMLCYSSSRERFQFFDWFLTLWNNCTEGCCCCCCCCCAKKSEILADPNMRNTNEIFSRIIGEDHRLRKQVRSQITTRIGM